MTSPSTIDYEITIFQLNSDHLGPNRATLLHARAKATQTHFYKAILYLHGYNDYFFHDHVCQQFLDHGYDFFALDLRKCGRSIISPKQDAYKHYFNDISEYYQEITLAILHMLNQVLNRQKKFFLLGHSTGGLVASLYTAVGEKRLEIDGLILNSPYLTELDTTFVESIVLGTMIKFGFSKDLNDNWYSRSIHRSAKGEWDFDCQKKPIDQVRIHGASFAAIQRGQYFLERYGSLIRCPILFLCSNKSLKPSRTWCDEYAEADLVLNVKSMRRVAATLGNQVTFFEIENAKHDIFLSKSIVREKAFTLVFRWLKCLDDA